MSIPSKAIEEPTTTHKASHPKHLFPKLLRSTTPGWGPSKAMKTTTTSHEHPI
jgi:hypothetical protein